MHVLFYLLDAEHYQCNCIKSFYCIVLLCSITKICPCFIPQGHQGQSLPDWCETGWPHNTVHSSSVTFLRYDVISCLCNRHFPALTPFSVSVSLCLSRMSPHLHLIHLRHQSSEIASLECWCSHAGLWIRLNGACVWGGEAWVGEESFVFLDRWMVFVFLVH